MGLWGVQMYIRHKIIHGDRYHYLCECKRVNGKPKQIVLAYLGRQATIDDCISYHRMQVSDLRKELARLSDRQTKRRASIEKRIEKSTAKIKELLAIQGCSAYNAP